MADKTKIEWTDATWNPITGCSVVSPGCTNCYAMRLAGTRMKHHPSRAGLTHDTKAGPVWTGEVRFNDEWLDQPIRWTKPRMIFVCAHGDLFAEGVKDEWLDKIFAVMALAPQHTYQVLTKRPERMREYLLQRDGEVDISTKGRIALEAADLSVRTGGGRLTVDKLPAWPLPNVWLGVSCEDQRRADERVPILLDTPAAIRWVSAEPLLGGIDFRKWMWPVHPTWPASFMSPADAIAAGAEVTYQRQALVSARAVFLDWIVAGGESGTNARPMHPDWVRRIRDDCAAAGTAFYFKQWGEFAPEGLASEAWHVFPTSLAVADPLPNGIGRHAKDGHWRAYRVGKKAAGRLLDGVEHNGFPEARP